MSVTILVVDDEENARRFLSIIRKHTERLRNIINDLLKLTQVETGKSTETIEVFDIKTL